MKAALELSSKPNRNGLYEIYVRVQEGEKKKRIKANVAVGKKQFKSKNHNLKWVVNHPNHHKINADLRALVEEYDDIMFSGAVEKRPLTAESLIHTANKGTFSKSLISFWEIKMSQMLEYNHRKGYQQALNNWMAYSTKEKLGDLDFKQIDVFILKGFENFLYKKKLSSSTVYSNLKRVRALFNMAIKEGVIRVEDYIFKAYTMPRAEKTTKERLTEEELKNFAAVTYEDGSLIKTVQQSFLLAFHLAGVRIEDLLSLKWEYVANGRVSYRMAKTGALNSFRVTEKLQEILDYFQDTNTKKSIFILPLLPSNIDLSENKLYKVEISNKTALVNKYLKKIAKDAGINKNVTSHISRHTFATIAGKRTGGDVVFLQSAFKHSSIAITQTYLRDLDNDSLDDKMSKVTDF